LSNYFHPADSTLCLFIPQGRENIHFRGGGFVDVIGRVSKTNESDQFAGSRRWTSALLKSSLAAVSLTADTALRLGRSFGVAAQFWLGLQVIYDRDMPADSLKKPLKKIENRLLPLAS
jgi:hypothetical protein